MTCRCATCTPPAPPVCCYCEARPTRPGEDFCSDACRQAHDEYLDQPPECTCDDEDGGLGCPYYGR